MERNANLQSFLNIKKKWDRCLVSPRCNKPQLYKSGECWEHIQRQGQERIKLYVDDRINEFDVINRIELSNFRGVDFNGRTIKNVTFYGCDFGNSKFTCGTLVNCRFEYCLLHDTMFVSSNLKRCTITDSYMRNSNFSNAKLVECSLNRSDMAYLVLTNVSYSEGVFENCNVNNSFLTKSMFFEVDFSGSDFLFSSFDASEGNGAIFDNADLTRASFIGAKLDKASFRGSNLLNARFQGSRCIETDFEGARLRGATMEAADLTRAKFSKNALTLTHLEGAILTGVDFEKCGLRIFEVERHGDRIIVTRKLLRRVNPRFWTWLSYEPKYLSAARIERNGIARGPEYIGGLLFGAGAACLMGALQWAAPVITFWIVFFVFVGIHIIPKSMRKNLPRQASLRFLKRFVFSRKSYISNADIDG